MLFASIFGIITMILNFSFLALGIYAILLLIKALRLYISKNS